MSQEFTQHPDAPTVGGLRRRRVRRMVAGAVPAVVAVALTAVVLPGPAGAEGSSKTGSKGAAEGSKRTDEKPTRAADRRKAAPKRRAAGRRLLTYQGPQADGFRIASIPEGFKLRVQASDAQHLILARDGDTSSSDVYVDKLVVFRRSESDQGSPGDPVNVNGQAGGIRSDDASTTITFKVDGLWLQAQSWSTVGLTKTQLVKFAEGVTISGKPSPTYG